MRVRDCFFTEIYNRTKSGEDFVIVSSDIGAPSLDQYRIDFAQRFVNVGIAEQNSIAVAAGLQVAGKKVITYGLNPFPVTRAFDQLRNFMGGLNIPITVTALNAGSCSADAGYTHMAVENMSLMRALKNIQIINPTDKTIVEKLISEILNNPNPRYVQFDKFIEANEVYLWDNIDFDNGFVVTKKESKIAIVTYGIMARELLKLDLPVTIIDCFSLPVNSDKLSEELKEYEKILTVEDGILEGGIGSLVLEILNDKGIQKQVIRKGIVFENGYPKRYINRNLLWVDEKITISELEVLIDKTAKETL